MTIKIKCAVAHCGRFAFADASDDEVLCGWHWRKTSGPLRRRYEAAWEEAERADKLGDEDVEAFSRVTDAWKHLLDHATGIGR